MTLTLTPALSPGERVLRPAFAGKSTPRFQASARVEEGFCRVTCLVAAFGARARPRSPAENSMTIDREILGQLQKRDDALFEFALGKAEHFFKFDGVGHVKLPGNCSAQGREVRAAAEFLAEFVREAADISALGAGDAKTTEGFLVIRELEIVDVNQARLAFDFDAFARKFVKRHTVLLDGRNHRRRLH